MNRVPLLSKAQVASTQSFERGTVCADDICIERFGSGDEPRVVLAKTFRRPTLEQRAPSRLRELQALNGESL